MGRKWVANGSQNFIPGGVYNIGGKPEWMMYIKEYSDHILNAVDPDDTLVYYEAAEPFTTKVKHMDF